MAFPRPIVWEDADIPSLIQYLCGVPEVAATLIVCSTKETFVKGLQALQGQTPLAGPHTLDGISLSGPSGHPLTELARPTLWLLSTSKRVKLVFCPDITHLRAYLATFPAEFASRTGAQKTIGKQQSPILAILNLVQLHRQTSAFSAQGINRTLANAVDASFHTMSQLIIVEYPLEISTPSEPDGSPQPESDTVNLEIDSNLWDEKVSILNVTTKSFGVGDRGWQGRTASLRSIAGRFCVFTKRVPNSSRT